MRTLAQAAMQLKLAAALALALIAAVAATATPQASVEAVTPPFVDVSVESKPFWGSNTWFHVIVTNNFHPEFSAQELRNVQVKIEPRVAGASLADGAQLVDGIQFNAATGIWTIAILAPGSSSVPDNGVIPIRITYVTKGMA